MDDNNASKMFLAVAVVLGVLATVMAFTFISSSAAPEGSKTREVVIAARDLQPNVSLDPAIDLKKDEIPAKFASSANRSLDPSNLPSYKGQKVNRLIRAGQPVNLSDLAAGGELILSGPGCRALSIRANAGLAATGDHVKILEHGLGVIIGQGDGFRVLAIGITLNTNRNQVTKVEQDAAANPARLVTLEVTDAQAQEIAKQINPNPDNNMLLVTPPATSATAPANR